jgi:hypothetical protein
MTREESEKKQRGRMEERLKNRSPSPATADFDLPAPNDDINDRPTQEPKS